MADAPPTDVLDAFGATDEPVPLPGGQGDTWRSGDIVIKPAGLAAETRWRAEVLTAIPASPRFRVARPVRARGGDWLHHGWEAWHALPGRTDVHRPDDVLRVAEPFHAAIAHLPRPDCIDRRNDPWSHGDRVAWGEAPVPTVGLLNRLAAIRRPVHLPDQAVHGDLLGNVLFDDRHRPGIIDWPVYWRPTAWSSAIVVVDALCWHGADTGLIERWSGPPQWRQMLIRALIFRIVTDHAADAAGRRWRPHPAYEPVADQVLTMPE